MSLCVGGGGHTEECSSPGRQGLNESGQQHKLINYSMTISTWGQYLHFMTKLHSRLSVIYEHNSFNSYYLYMFVKHGNLIYLTASPLYSKSGRLMFTYYTWTHFKIYLTTWLKSTTMYKTKQHTMKTRTNVTNWISKNMLHIRLRLNISFRENIL